MTADTTGAGSSRVAANTVLSLVAILALGLTRLIFSLLVGRQLGREALGQVNTQLSIATFASLAFATGTSIGATKFVPALLGGKDAAQARRALIVLLRWCMLGTAGVTAVVAVVLPWLFDEFSGAEIVATCFLVVAYSAYTFVRGAQYGYGTIRKYAVIETLCDASTIAGAVIVVMLDVELILLLPFIAGYTVFAVVGWLGLPRPARTPGVTVPTALRREMRGYGFWAALGVLASTGFLQLSMVFAYLYGGTSEAGLYAAAMTLTVPAYFVPRALSMALFPSMANAFGRGDEEEIRRQLDTGTRLLMVATLPFFAGAILLARPLLTFTFRRAEFAQAHLVLELLLAATYILICSIPAVNSLSATERNLVRIPAAAAISGLTVGVVSWLILGPVLGTTGIAVGYLAGAVVTSGICIFAAWRRWHQAWTTLLWRVGLAAALAAGLWVLVDVRWNTLGIRLGCVLGVAGITTMMCPQETRQIVGRLRQVTRQARGILTR